MTMQAAQPWVCCALDPGIIGPFPIEAHAISKEAYALPMPSACYPLTCKKPQALKQSLVSVLDQNLESSHSQQAMSWWAEELGITQGRP